ncbi:MAG: hypothetical protein ACE5IW_02975 [bacterium]
MMKLAIKNTIFVSAMLFFAFFMLRQILILRIPVGQKFIPTKIVREEIPIPKRPGTKSIRILAPTLKKLKFEIDFKRNPLILDWDFLEKSDKEADVRAEGIIDVAGNFTITNIYDKGHPEAGRYIKKILSTWNFVQYKMGNINYYFNVPTKKENMKVQIDLRGLSHNAKYIEKNDEIIDGLLYYIKGIDRSNVLMIK